MRSKDTENTRGSMSIHLKCADNDYDNSIRDSFLLLGKARNIGTSKNQNGSSKIH